MMAPLKKTSYGQKLLGLAVLTSGMAVALVCSVLFYVEYIDAERRAVSELESITQLIATHSEAAMAFNDTQAGSETLAALHALVEIQSACIFNRSGERFACYGDGGALPVSGEIGDDVRIDDGVLHLAQPIAHDGETLGSVVLRYDMSSVSQRLTSRATIAASVGVFAIVLSLLLASALRRRLTLPVNELVETAKRVSDEDYTVRARRYADDELGMLTDAFNHMLNQIEERDNELGRSIELVGALRESRGRLAVAQRMAGLGYWTWNTETEELTISEELATICGIQDIREPSSSASIISTARA